MITVKMKYGESAFDVSLEKDHLLGIIESKDTGEKKTEDEVIKEALASPINSKQLREIVHGGETVCVIISDITRAWQRMDQFLPYIVEELNLAGVRDQDIRFLCATGSHRKQTKEEHRALLGEALANRFEVIDHDCMDKDNLVYLGTTSFGTPVLVNKMALDCDHMILTGAVVFHDLAGWGGGKKSILPGICGYESIMANHKLSLNPESGAGSNPLVRCGNTVNNPLHEDMLEAAAFVKPSFLFNVIMNEEGRIGQAVAGDYIKAHEIGQRMVEEMDGVWIREKADLAMVSAGGYPKDINLYQASKALSNAKEAVKPGGAIILMAECTEGFGHEEVQWIIENYSSNLERELALREAYSIAKYTGYMIAEVAARMEVVLVSEMNEEQMAKIGIKVVKDLEAALAYVYGKRGKNLTIYCMPQGSSTLPKNME